MAINRVNLSGNLTRDAELTATQGGTQVARFGLAVNERVKNQRTGEWESRPNFIDCVMFGLRAEKLAQYLCKGTKVAVEGRLRYSSWEKDGERRSKIEVIVDEVEFMSRSQQGEGGGYAPAPAPQQAPAPMAAPAPPAVDVYDEDIPF